MQIARLGPNEVEQLWNRLPRRKRTQPLQALRSTRVCLWLPSRTTENCCVRYDKLLSSLLLIAESVNIQINPVEESVSFKQKANF